MILSKLLYKAYHQTMRLAGLDYQIRRYINKEVKLQHGVNTILEVGCGTGITGLSFLTLHPNASLILTDNNQESQNKLQKVIRNEQNISFGLADISQPREISILSGNHDTTTTSTYDLVISGACIGYAKDPSTSLSELYTLTHSPGSIICFEMNTRFLGKLVSKIYNYGIVKEEFYLSLESRGAHITVRKIPWKYFPLNLTRVFIAVEKHSPGSSGL